MNSELVEMFFTSRRHQQSYAIAQTLMIMDTENFQYEDLVYLENAKVGKSLQNLMKDSELLVCSKSTICVVCQDYTTCKKDVVRKLNCNHIFHANCIDKWFCENIKCPLCNK